VLPENAVQVLADLRLAIEEHIRSLKQREDACYTLRDERRHNAGMGGSRQLGIGSRQETKGNTYGHCAKLLSELPGVRKS